MADFRRTSGAGSRGGLLLLLLLVPLGCTAPTRDLNGLWSAQDYQGSFQYRYGDSPRGVDQRLSFADPQHDDGGWQAAKGIGKPPGRGDAEVLWLRTRLSGPQLARPVLYLRLASHTVDMFIDGQAVTPQAGERTAVDRRVSTRAEYLIPLGPDYVGKTLALRVVSFAPMIGIGAPPRLGDSAVVALDLVRRNGTQGLVSLLFLFLAVAGGVLFCLRRADLTYLYFAICCGGIGIYNLTLTGLLGVLIPWPFPQLPSQLLSLALAGAAICSYFGAVLDLGPLRVLHWLRLLWLSYCVITIAVLVFDPRLLLSLIQPINILSALHLLGLVVTAALGARRGDVDAKLLTLGFIATFVLMLPDVLIASGAVAGAFGSSINAGLLAWGLSLAAILVRRVVAEHNLTLQLQIEHTLTNRRLEEQDALLQAAARMAKGDLEKRIEVGSPSPLAPLAVALDGMRQDLKAKLQLLDGMQKDLHAKVETLEKRHQEIGHLNDELRRQIEQRSRRLIDMLLPTSGTPRVAPKLLPGDLLGDYYRVIRTLGEGGMGAVYEVERTTDGCRLAAKVLHDATVDRSALVRFAREAQIMARLSHPSLVAISDVDVTSQGILYLVMELVNGSSLWQLRDHFQDLAWDRTVLAQIADALAALHASGVVHRDLKPENVLVVDGGLAGRPIVKLADFGISMLVQETRVSSSAASPPPGAVISVGLRASAAQGSDALMPTLSALAPLPRAEAAEGIRPPSLPSSERQLTETGVIMGTPIYMAPELLLGSRYAQPAADVFSLGVLAFEMFTGQPPFAQPPILIHSLGGVLLITPLLRNQPGLDPTVVALIERCLETAPERRPSARELADALGDSAAARAA